MPGGTSPACKSAPDRPVRFSRILPAQTQIGRPKALSTQSNESRLDLKDWSLRSKPHDFEPADRYGAAAAEPQNSEPRQAGVRELRLARNSRGNDCSAHTHQ